MLRAFSTWARGERKTQPPPPPPPSAPPPKPRNASQLTLAAELVHTNAALVQVVHGYQQLLTMMTQEAFKPRHQVPMPEDDSAGPADSDATSVIYVLQLRQQKYYVGKTKHLLARFKQHEDGEGAAWTRKYKPVRIVATYPCTVPNMENAVVKLYMGLKGVDNVRGGAYANDVLTAEQKRCIDLELMHDANKCFKCNTTGHFMRDCPQRATAAAADQSNSVANQVTLQTAAANPDEEELYFWK